MNSRSWFPSFLFLAVLCSFVDCMQYDFPHLQPNVNPNNEPTEESHAFFKAATQSKPKTKPHGPLWLEQQNLLNQQPWKLLEEFAENNHSERESQLSQQRLDQQLYDMILSPPEDVVTAVSTLCEQGADANQIDDNDDNLLHIICRKRDFDAKVCDILLQHGANRYELNRDNLIPLQVCLREKPVNVPVAKRLLKDFEYHHFVDTEGDRTLLHQAAIRSVLLEELLAIDGFRTVINLPDLYGRTPLHYASMVGANVDLLLKENVEVSPKDDMGRTPLHYAANADVVWHLLMYGANINEHDSDQYSPLDIAIISFSPEVIIALIAGVGSEGAIIDKTIFKHERLSPVSPEAKRLRRKIIDDILSTDVTELREGILPSSVDWDDVLMRVGGTFGRRLPFLSASAIDPAVASWVPNFRCAITGRLPEDPVLASDGNTVNSLTHTTLTILTPYSTV